METRIRFCVVLDALAVFTLISAGLSLFGAKWLPIDSLQLFGWLFAASLTMLALARVSEILRVIMRTPDVLSMRAPRAAPQLDTTVEQPATANFSRAA